MSGSGKEMGQAPIEAELERAKSLIGKGQPERALPVLSSIVSSQPGFLAGWLELARAFGRAKMKPTALLALARAEELSPGDPLVQFSKGNLLAEFEEHEEAYDCYSKSLERLQDPEIYFNRGNSARALHRYEEAVTDYDKAIELKPDHTGAFSNRGNSLLDLERLDDALASFDRAQIISPNDPEVLRSKANALLYKGASRDAWMLYEHRHFSTSYRRAPEIGLELLSNTSPEGKHIFVQWEQAFGDVIQMMRFIPLLERRAASCVWQLPSELTRLARRSFPQSDFVTLAEAPPPACTHRLPFTSLPLALEIFSDEDIPCDAYLKADADAASRIREEWPGERLVGLAWRGRPKPANRSIALSELGELIAEPGLRFLALQQELLAEEEKIASGLPGLVPLSSRLVDFDATAAAIEAVELVVTIDTSVAHLAGALGKPALLMLKQGADWRWKFEGSRCVWYPSLTLFRQSELGNWNGVLVNVRTALRDYIQTRHES